MNYLRHFRQSCTAKTVEPPHPFFSVKSQIAINKSVCVSLLLLGPKLREQALHFQQEAYTKREGKLFRGLE